MASKSKRHKARAQRRKHESHHKLVGSEIGDPYARLVVESLASVESLIEALNPAEDGFDDRVESEFVKRVEALADAVSPFDPVRLAEVARLAYLPIAPVGTFVANPEGGGAQLELLILIALAESETGRDGSDRPLMDPPLQQMSETVSAVWPDIDLINSLGLLRGLAQIDQTDPLAMISFSVRGSEATMRNSSYPDMAQATVRELLDGSRTIESALEAGLGFNAADAIAVLNACHKVQLDKMNARGERFAHVLPVPLDGEDAQIGLGRDADLRDAFAGLFEPAATEVTVTFEELAQETGIALPRVAKIVAHFTLSRRPDSAVEAAGGFLRGDNPWRQTPLLSSADGRVMQLHDAHNATAVKESLEEHLKGTPTWNIYAKHRGDLLEERVRDAILRALPHGVARNGFEFYIPATEEEARAGDPAQYTKRVECDHLILVDDVAVVVEDKAVAFSALSRAGKMSRQRTDLTGIVTKAAEQAARVSDAIDRDGGLRIEDEGWVDLAHIRETHTIAVSLDDIAPVLTATAELVEAGIIPIDNIPWTVSLHDLELIVELVDRPAEFLLYLRRRRDPAATVFFTAPDELDLFLYFYEAGLWVQPDPNLVRDAFPFLPPPSTGELRRFRQQSGGFITSRTDALDRWHYTRASTNPAPKPSMVTSSVMGLVDELERRQVYCWLSIGATLLSGSSTAQEQFARNGPDLLRSLDPSGKGRSITVPLAQSVDAREGWLLVWVTKPPVQDVDRTIANLQDYMLAKKDQLGIPRAVAFLYDEESKVLLDVTYVGTLGAIAEHLSDAQAKLRPASDLQRRLPPSAKRGKRARQSKSQP